MCQTLEKYVYIFIFSLSGHLDPPNYAKCLNLSFGALIWHPLLTTSHAMYCSNIELGEVPCNVTLLRLTCVGPFLKGIT